MLAGVVWVSGGTLHRLTALVAVVDVALFFLPWSLPRRDWSAKKFWFESLLYLAPMGLLLAVAALVRAPWIVTLADPLWFAVGILAGGGLIVLSGVDVRDLLSGDLAFLAGPDNPQHSRARAAHSALAAVCEESFFRGACFAANVSVPVLTLVTSAAFVVRHRLVRGVPRSEARALAVETAGAACFCALVLASGSIYPAVVAHVVANVPYVALELQRAALGRRESRGGSPR